MHAPAHTQLQCVMHMPGISLKFCFKRSNKQAEPPPAPTYLPYFELFLRKTCIQWGPPFLAEVPRAIFVKNDGRTCLYLSIALSNSACRLRSNLGCQGTTSRIVLRRCGDWSIQSRTSPQDTGGNQSLQLLRIMGSMKVKDHFCKSCLFAALKESEVLEFAETLLISFRCQSRKNSGVVL